MKRNIILFFAVFITVLVTAQQVKPTKNIILMIPDGTSLSVLSASRWLKVYRNEGTHLNIDAYLSGTVTTFSSNAPIGDSAPTTSCYMTGIPSQAANISMYPVADPGNDLVKLNPDSAYQPLATIAEGMRLMQNKATGLVVTCEFPHATPADCGAHYYSRSDYKSIAPQMAANNLNVMFGGGTSFVTDDMKKHFAYNGTTYLQNDKTGMMNYAGKRIWALFGEREMPYDLDRDTSKIPSIAQMTKKAIEILSKNENGFFLMVEGSKVDWAAHANDPIGIMSEFTAFDKAVGEAINFAKKDGNTMVLVLPDHGNSGFSIGKQNMKKSYTKMTLEDLFGAVSKYKTTAEGLEKILLTTKPENIKSVFKKNTDIDLTADELKSLLTSKNYKAESYTSVSDSENMTHYITKIMNDRTTFGFTTGGHTGEEVFLACYHPNGDILKGNVRNTEVNRYLYKASGLNISLQELTNKLFSKHTEVFAGYDYKIIPQKNSVPMLVVKNKKNTLQIPAFSSVVLFNDKLVEIGSAVVYVDKNNTFYLPKSLSEKLK